MLEILKNQESDLLKYLFAANSEISKITAVVMPSESVTSKIKSYLKFAEIGYQAMSETMNQMTDSERANYQIRLAVYREKTESLKAKVLNRFVESKNALKGEPESKGNLENAYKLGVNSQEIGVKSLNQLKSQMEIISGYDNQEKMKKYSNEVDKLLGELNFKKIKLKLSMLLIILLEFLIILLVLYIKLI